MRLLFLNAGLSDRGGADRWLLAVLARLQGAEETLLAVGRRAPGLAPEEERRIGRWLLCPGLDRRGLRSRGRERAVEALRGLIEREAPDRIHANDLTDPDLLELVARTGRGLLTVQDHRLFCPGRGKLHRSGAICSTPLGDRCLDCLGDPGYGARMLELTRRRLAAARGMAGITVLSRYMAGELIRVGLPRERITVIPPFVDGWLTECSPGDPPGPRRYHLMLGRLVEHKGVRDALAAARLLHRPPGLLIVGEGPLSDEVDRAARAAPDRIRREPWADRARLAELLDGAVSVWLPSRWAEPFGIAGLEALSRGVPVVASRVGGIPEWLSDREGCLVEPGDPAVLAAAADALAAEPERARRQGERGRARATREHDPAASMARLRELYRGLLRPAPGG